MDCSLTGSSVHGIFQARILEWWPFISPGDLPEPGMEPTSSVSLAAGRFFTTVQPGWPLYFHSKYKSRLCFGLGFLSRIKIFCWQWVWMVVCVGGGCGQWSVSMVVCVGGGVWTVGSGQILLWFGGRKPRGFAEEPGLGAGQSWFESHSSHLMFLF